MPPLTRRRALIGTAALVGALALPRRSAAQAAPNRLIEETATLARSSITARLDRERGYQPYFHLDVASDPPEGLHSSWDYVDTAGRFTGAFVALRQLGIAVDPDAERGVRTFFLANQAADGLFYDQQSEWSEEAVETFAQSRAMAALVEIYLDGDRSAEQRIERMISGLARLVEPSGEGVAFPGRRWRGGWLDRSLTAAGADDRIAKPGYGALVAEPLLRYVAASDSRPAAEFAASLISGFYAAGAIADDGSYLGHTHSWGILPVTLATLELGRLTGQDSLFGFAVSVFEFTASQGTPWGWIPDGIGFAPGYPGGWFCETCGLADLIVLGVRLGQQGYAPAWGQVERFVRNQLVANQFRAIDRIIPPDRASRSATNAAAMLRGSFDAWARPNSLLGGLDLLDHGGLEACCTGSAVMALREVQRSAVSLRNGTLWVDLPLTLRSPLADIQSFEPSEGFLTITVRAAGPLAVRLTEPANAVAVDGVPRAFVHDAGVLRLETLGAGSRVEIRYPLAERLETRLAGGLAVTARWRGATVVSLDPPGERYPIFHER